MIRLTPEQEEFRKSVARFVDAEVIPAADAMDDAGEFPARSSGASASSAISACGIRRPTGAPMPTW